MKHVLIVLCAACAAVCGGCAGGFMGQGGSASRGVVFDELGTGEKFAVYVPRGEAPQSGWPCIVFLNGSGECGTDGQRQLTQGLMPAVLNRPEEWPFVIVFPQKPTRESKWLDHKKMVMACLERARERWALDGKRVYLTGLSQGGNGTWEIAAADSGRTFAAIAPVCGYGDAAGIAPGVAGQPVWAFHGEKDDVVPPGKTRVIIGAIEDFLEPHGGDARAARIEKDDGTASPLRMTIYPDLNHGCWDRAYRDSGLAGWFLRFESPARSLDRDSGCNKRR